MQVCTRYRDCQRAAAALRAASLRCSGVVFAARALPPLSPRRRPSATAAGSLPAPDRASALRRLLRRPAAWRARWDRSDACESGQASPVARTTVSGDGGTRLAPLPSTIRGPHGPWDGREASLWTSGKSGATSSASSCWVRDGCRCRASRVGCIHEASRPSAGRYREKRLRSQPREDRGTPSTGEWVAASQPDSRPSISN